MSNLPSRHRPTLTDLILKHQITTSAHHSAVHDPTFFGSTCWMVEMRRPGTAFTYTKPFYMGPGLGARPPETAEFLEAQLREASTVHDNPSFATWCGDLGYATDDRRAKSIHQKVLVNYGDLTQFLDDLFETFLYAEPE